MTAITKCTVSKKTKSMHIFQNMGICVWEVHTFCKACQWVFKHVNPHLWLEQYSPKKAWMIVLHFFLGICENIYEEERVTWDLLFSRLKKLDDIIPPSMINYYSVQQLENKDGRKFHHHLIHGINEHIW